MRVHGPYFRADGTEIVFKGATPDPTSTWAYYVSALDDPDPRPLTAVTSNEVFGGMLSPDGSTWAYSKWDTPKGIEGDLYAIDVDSRTERPLHVAGGDVPGTADLNPIWSPDAQLLLVQRFKDGMYDNVLVRADGSGEAIVLAGRPRLTTADDPERLFSPDGSSVVIRYPEDSSVWMYDVATGKGTEVGAQLEGLSWQRVAD